MRLQKWPVYYSCRYLLVFLAASVWELPSIAAVPANLFQITSARQPPDPNGGPPSSVIPFASRRHALALRFRCGISKISKTVCVVMRSMPSSPIFPRNRSSGRCQESAFRATISACACFILSSHDNVSSCITGGDDSANAILTLTTTTQTLHRACVLFGRFPT